MAGSKMLETPPPSLPRQYTHSSPNICSGEKGLAELLLDIQQGPSVLSPPLLGVPPGSEWRRRRLKKSKVVEGSAGLSWVCGGQTGTQTLKGQGCY